MTDLHDTEMTGTISTARHQVVRYVAELNCGRAFGPGCEYEGPTLTIEVADAADAQAMLDAISAAPAGDMRGALKAHITAVLEGIRHLSVDDAADLLAEIADDLSEDRSEDMINGAILDGIRWGYTAAVTVEMGGGAMLRAILPGGCGITHQWAKEDVAQPQIRAALEGLHHARVSASNAGDE